MHETNLNIETLDRLHAVLEAEIAQYEQAVGALSRKKECLVAGKPQLLLDIDRELLAVSQRTAQLEQERHSLMARLGFEQKPLAQLIAGLAPAQANRLRRDRDCLRRAVDDVARLNRESRDLLSLSLRWIQETVELVAEALTPEASSYTAQGGKSTRKGADAVSAPVHSTVNHSA